MRARLLAVAGLALLSLGTLPVAGQGVEPDVVCLTNSVDVPTRESRVFCEPLDSAGFVQFEQFVAGVQLLASEYPDYVEVRQIGTSVQGRPILFVEVTNEKSATPRGEKLQLGYSASIHANEAAGREGMTRVIEDLAAGRGPVLTGGSGPWGAAAKPLLDDIILNVWFPNPDSWARGDYFSSSDILGVHAGQGFTRGNANGTDLNRQFPNPGWILPSHDPMTEPEARAVVSELRYSGNHTNLVAGADLHGMLNSQNMVRSIIPNQDYDFRRMVLVVDQLRQMQERIDNNPSFAEWNAVAAAGGTFEDAIAGPISQVPTVCAPDAAGPLAGQCVQPCVPDPSGLQGDVCGPTDAIDSPFLWGARWDQIGYTDTGFTSDYMTLSPRSPTGGMGAVGQIVEFAYSHMVPDNKYVAKLTDMHVAGVREIVRTQMEQAVRLESPVLAGTGPVGYVWAPDWVSSDDDPNAWGWDAGNLSWSKPEFSLGGARFDFRQVPYNVSNLVFWRDLGRFSADPFTPVPPQDVTPGTLAGLKHLTITDQAVEALSDGAIAAIRSWVEGGGHLLLTDGGIRFFDHAGLAESARICEYLGYTDLTTRDHPLLADVDWNARTTGEATAVGIGATQDGADEYPNWGLVPGSVAALGGDLVGTTGQLEVLGGGQAPHGHAHGGHRHGPSAAPEAAAAPNTERCQPTGSLTMVESLGRVPLGQGHIDFLGAALPRPTQAYDHRYGLADYSVSALTYWIVMNSLGGHVEYQPIAQPFVPTYAFDPLYGDAATRPGGEGDKGQDTAGLGLVVLLAGLAAALVVARRQR